VRNVPFLGPTETSDETPEGVPGLVTEVPHGSPLKTPREGPSGWSRSPGFTGAEKRSRNQLLGRTAESRCAAARLAGPRYLPAGEAINGDGLWRVAVPTAEGRAVAHESNGISACRS